jgi:c-di-GMP-binding flagellar brake protein YcgR
VHELGDHFRYTYRPVGYRPEKRDRERIEILGELHGEVMIFEPLSIKEISRGGCLVETAFPLHLNSLHEVRLTLGEQSVVLKGRVAHCRISDVDQEIVTYRSGLEFIELNERVSEAIREFIEAIKSGRKAR